MIEHQMKEIQSVINIIAEQAGFIEEADKGFRAECRAIQEGLAHLENMIFNNKPVKYQRTKEQYIEEMSRGY